MAITTFPIDEKQYLGGITWDAFVEGMKKNQELIRTLYAEVSIDETQAREAAESVRRRGGQVALAVMTERWCGDSTVNLPVIARMCESVPGLSMRIFIAKDNPVLQKHYEDQGIRTIPVVSMLDAQWREIGRWVERPAAAVEPLENWLAGHPELDALAASSDPKDKLRRIDIFDGLLLEMAEWYRGGLWAQTAGELEAMMAVGKSSKVRQ